MKTAQNNNNVSQRISGLESDESHVSVLSLRLPAVLYFREETPRHLFIPWLILVFIRGQRVLLASLASSLNVCQQADDKVWL